MSVKIGLIGWRGMVGSVLLDRMQTEGDLDKFEVGLYSTSQVGQASPVLPNLRTNNLLDAFDLSSLAENEIIISCQGGEYTKRVYSDLRLSGWSGYWVDAASTLRMEKDSCIVLDPVNQDQIAQALAMGVRTFVGGNCTVSLLLMALAPLFRAGLVEWLSSMTYQAASGAGARQMSELLAQSKVCLAGVEAESNSLAQESHVQSQMSAEGFPMDALGYPLAYNILPFIDILVDGGQSREEWKAEVEINKILGSVSSIPVDGVCVRVPVLRCHSQAFLVKLTQPLGAEEVERMLSGSHEWIDVVPNQKEATLNRLTPAAVSGSLTVAVGRLRNARMGPDYIAGFTVGDQLLWGAAEPLRRMALLLLEWLER